MLEARDSSHEVDQYVKGQIYQLKWFLSLEDNLSDTIEERVTMK